MMSAKKNVKTYTVLRIKTMLYRFLANDFLSNGMHNKVYF